MLVIKQLMVPIDFHSTSFPTMENNGDQQLFGFSKFFKISVFNLRKKLIDVWNDMRVSKLQNQHFCVNIDRFICLYIQSLYSDSEGKNSSILFRV